MSISRYLCLPMSAVTIPMPHRTPTPKAVSHCVVRQERQGFGFAEERNRNIALCSQAPRHVTKGGNLCNSSPSIRDISYFTCSMCLFVASVHIRSHPTFRVFRATTCCTLLQDDDRSQSVRMFYLIIDMNSGNSPNSTKFSSY